MTREELDKNIESAVYLAIIWAIDIAGGNREMTYADLVKQVIASIRNDVNECFPEEGK